MKNPLFFSAFVCVLFSCGAQKTGLKTPVVVYRSQQQEAAYPRLSANSKEILYQSNESGKWQLRILDLETMEHRALFTDTFNNNFPDWNPKNDLVAFVSDRSGDEDIYLYDVKSGQTRQIISDPARDIHPYFSPDGKYILFNSTRGNESLDIYRYDLQSGKTLRITDTEDNETCARYSNNMKHIVYLRNGVSGDDVFLMDTDSFLPVNLSQTPPTYDGWPMFSPDDKWIYFSSMETGFYHIYRMDLEGKKKTQLTNALAGEEDARVYVAPSNDFFIYNKRKGKTIEILKQEI
ncbi:MAG: tolB [Crocinitomicaceae bacterium]|jgi:TolB protein|nr:tolB [Crocinitomicaceae bacterium]